MTGRERRHVAALARRRRRLTEILDDWQGKPGGDDRARQELAALDYALRLIQNADDFGLLTSLFAKPSESYGDWIARQATTQEHAR